MQGSVITPDINGPPSEILILAYSSTMISGRINPDEIPIPNLSNTMRITAHLLPELLGRLYTSDNFYFSLSKGFNKILRFDLVCV